MVWATTGGGNVHACPQDARLTQPRARWPVPPWGGLQPGRGPLTSLVTPSWLLGACSWPLVPTPHFQMFGWAAPPWPQAGPVASPPGGWCGGSAVPVTPLAGFCSASSPQTGTRAPDRHAGNLPRVPVEEAGLEDELCLPPPHLVPAVRVPWWVTVGPTAATWGTSGGAFPCGARGAAALARSRRLLAAVRAPPRPLIWDAPCLLQRPPCSVWGPPDAHPWAGSGPPQPTAPRGAVTVCTERPACLAEEGPESGAGRGLWNAFRAVPVCVP